jgi:hypothetical protein
MNASEGLKIEGIEAAGADDQRILESFLEDPERAIRNAIKASCYNAPLKYEVLECRFLCGEDRQGKGKEADYRVVKLAIKVEAGRKKERYNDYAVLIVFSNKIPTFVRWDEEVEGYFYES